MTGLIVALVLLGLPLIFVIVTGMLGFPPEAEEFFEVEPMEREPIKVNF